MCVCMCVYNSGSERTCVLKSAARRDKHREWDSPSESIRKPKPLQKKRFPPSQKKRWRSTLGFEGRTHGENLVRLLWAPVPVNRTIYSQHRHLAGPGPMVG